MEKLLFEEIPKMGTQRIKRCAWCHELLPNERYRLKICPSCRKASIEAFKETFRKELRTVREETLFRPIIGIYTCLLCERRFSTKSRLKGHYCGEHDLSPHYRARKADGTKYDLSQN